MLASARREEFGSAEKLKRKGEEGEMSEASGKSGNSLKWAVVLAAVLGSSGGLALAQSNEPPCPDSSLAPDGLVPNNGEYCGTPYCMLRFKNYKWWVAYHFNKQTGYYNGGLKTIFPPNNVSLGVSDGFLHLKVAEQDNCRDRTGSIVWCGAEAVLMFDAGEPPKQANLGYGDYLVEARLVAPLLATWADYDPNVAFGVFTYARPASGTADNPAREIDLAEVSRWGWDQIGPITSCPYYNEYNGKFFVQELCKGNAQFALQDFTKKAGMVKRYSVAATKEITLIMRWRPGKVTFEEYNVGGPTLKGSLPDPDYIWETPNDPKEPEKDLSAFVPTDRKPGGELSCQRFHINLWLGNFKKTKDGLNPGPSQPVEVAIKNFEFDPK
jgi:hypothetical protein